MLGEVVDLLKYAKAFVVECWKADFSEEAVSEFLSKSCIHQKSIGRCIGSESFISDCYDWSKAFPDYGTDILSINTCQNAVVMDVMRFGTHQEVYGSSNKSKETVLTKSKFLSGVVGADPTGITYRQPAQLIFVFQGKKITQVSIDEDPHALSEELGLDCRGPKASLETEIKRTVYAINQTLKAELSIREIEVIALSFCGFSAKHIAELFHLSHRTIETHLQHAYQKLGCFGKQHALEMMFENDLLTLWLELGKLVVQKMRCISGFHN